MIKFSERESKLPFWLLSFIDTGLTRWRGIDWSRAGGGSDRMVKSDGREPAATVVVTEVFDSHLTYCQARVAEHTSDDCLHTPILDIDVGAFVIESSTAGHSHLYLNHTVRWKDYKELLLLLARMGIIEENYAKVSIARGGTSLRAPWIRKGKESESVVAAVNDFLAEPPKTTTRLRPVPFPFP